MSAPANTQPLIIQRAGRPMACAVSVQIAAQADQMGTANAAADACMAWFDEVDARLSRFRPASELSQLNRAAGDWVAVSDTLFEAIAVALWAARASEGLFDPTLLRQIEALGYDRDFALIAHRETSATGIAGPFPALPAVPAEPAWRHIALDAHRRRVRLPLGAALDLGGIAKGWAADVARARYCGSFASVLINVGGDLRAEGGPAPGKPWLIGLRDPRHELADPAAVPDNATTHLAAIQLSRGGLATSGAIRRWWLRAGTRQHHLLDPRTGGPLPLWIDERDTPESGPDAPHRIATVTALAPTAARAEAATKAALVRGFPDAQFAVRDAWQRYGALGPDSDSDVDAGVALVLTLDTGAIVPSANLDAYLATWGTAGAPVPVMATPSRSSLAKGD